MNQFMYGSVEMFWHEYYCWSATELEREKIRQMCQSLAHNAYFNYLEFISENFVAIEAFRRKEATARAVAA